MSKTDMLLEKRRNIARQINDVLGEQPEVTSVFVHGSVASGQVDERSDVDMTFVCRSDILSLSTRKSILSQIGLKWRFNDPSLNNPIWAECDTDGVVDDILVTVHYQTVSCISEVLNEVIYKGAITTKRVSFRPYTIAALLQRAWLLRDKDGIFNEWLGQIKVYPQCLKRNILCYFVPVLRENAKELKSHAERRLGPGVYLFFLTRAADALESILFALNEVYDPADRRAELIVLPTLSCVPKDFIPRYMYILKGPFDESGALERARMFKHLATEVLKMAEKSMS